MCLAACASVHKSKIIFWYIYLSHKFYMITFWWEIQVDPFLGFTFWFQSTFYWKWNQLFEKVSIQIDKVMFFLSFALFSHWIKISILIVQIIFKHFLVRNVIIFWTFNKTTLLMDTNYWMGSIYWWRWIMKKPMKSAIMFLTAEK